MTYAMSMSSEVTTKTIRINMTTNRIATVTNRNVTIRINMTTNRITTVTNHNGGWQVTMNDAATTQMRGAMEIAAQSVVAYLPIVRCAPLRPDARASGCSGYCSSIRRRRAFVRSIWRWYSVSRATL